MFSIRVEFCGCPNRIPGLKMGQAYVLRKNGEYVNMFYSQERAEAYANI